MGYLETANNMADNVMKTLSNVMDSKFATFLQGNGTPVLVTYYHVDDTISTTDSGTYSVDKVLGPNSPLRFNRIEKMPVVGLRELIPAIDQVDAGLLDLSIDGEIILFPNTIKPTPHDFVVYKYLNGNSLTFRVDSFEFSSIKNNNFYKLSISLKDINDTDTVDKLEAQTIKGFVARLDTIGTQDRCIIEDKIYAEINSVKKCRDHLVSTYKNHFYDHKYKCLLLRNSQFNGYNIFDPYLSKFITNNEILDTDGEYCIANNFDSRVSVNQLYMYTLYYNLEHRDSSHINILYMEPTSFKDTLINPFYYYGDEVAFTLDIVPTETFIDGLDSNLYDDRQLLEAIIYHDYPDKPYLEARPSGEGMSDRVSDELIYQEKDRTLDVFDASHVTLESFDRPDIKKEPDTIEIVHKNQNISITEINDAFDDDIYDSDEDEPYDEELDDIYDEDIRSNDASEIPVFNKESIKVEPKPEPTDLVPFYLNHIRKYMTEENLYNLFTIEDIDKLNTMRFNYDKTTFMYMPVVIYLLDKYIAYLTNEK